MTTQLLKVDLLQLASCGFSFSDPLIGGWKHIGFSLNGQVGEGAEIIDGSRLVFRSGTLEQTLDFVCQESERSLIVTRRVKNCGTTPVVIDEISDGVFSLESSVYGKRHHEYNAAYLHTDNARMECYPDSRPQYPYLRQIPYEPVSLGHGEGNPLPALVLCDLVEDTVLVEGDLDQREFLRTWQLGSRGPGEKTQRRFIRTYRGVQTLPLSKPLVLQPGEEKTVSTVFYQLLKGVKPEEATGGYFKELGRRYTLMGQSSPMLTGSVFCTWNYGTLHNIDEDLLQVRAKAVAERVPGCTFFLIDDGYQHGRGNRNGPLDCFYPSPAEGYDRAKFPSGMKAMADTIRQHGLRPAIWLNPSVDLDSSLAREHPDWLLLNREGSPQLLSQYGYLDLSVNGARDFFLSVLDALFVDWGYEGVKFDFMTHWFTLESACFGEGNGPYWRDWVFREIRERIGESGLFMTCIAMNTGNPFLARYADCYRCGCDIHDGTWAEQVKACRMTLSQILLEGRQTSLLNMDSAGFGDVPENEQLFRLTWVFITQGILELGGPVETFDERKVALWQKLLRHCDRGHRVQCLDEHALTGDGLPEMLKVEYPPDSRMGRAGIHAHIAFFNWQERAKPIGGERAFLGIPSSARVTDFWSGEDILMGTDRLAAWLAPRSARLYTILS